VPKRARTRRAADRRRLALAFAFHGLRLPGFPGFPGLPETPNAPSLAQLSWSCEEGPFPVDVDGSFREIPHGLAIEWGGYARYEVTGDHDGAQVRVMRDGIDEAEAARGFLFSVFPAALPLFGLEPLHGSAVEVDGGALLMLGATGSGKSSIAAAFGSLGYAILSDDACALDADADLWPGPPLVNPRWRGSELAVVSAYNGKVVQAGATGSRVPHELTGIVLVKPQDGTDFGVRELTSAEAFPEILANARLPGVLADLRRSTQLLIASAVARRPCVEVRFDPIRHEPDAIATSLMTRMGEMHARSRD
jgi:hypothetical protein